MSIAQKSVTELISTELSSVNTNHPDFSIKDAFNNDSNMTNIQQESINYPTLENGQNSFRFSIPNNPQQQQLKAHKNLISLGGTNIANIYTENNLGNLMNKKTELNAEIIYKLIQNYFPIVKKTVQDQIPKIVMCKIINHMKENMQNELLHKLLKEKDVDLLKESEE